MRQAIAFAVQTQTTAAIDHELIHGHRGTEIPAVLCHILIKTITLTAMRSQFSMKNWRVRVYHLCTVATEPFQRPIDVRAIQITIMQPHMRPIIRISMNVISDTLAVETILEWLLPQRQ